MSGVDKNSILESVMGEARDGYADFLRERTQEIEASPEDFSKDTRREGDYDLENKVTLEKTREIETEHGDSFEPIKTEEIKQAEREKFDELMGVVDKFKALAKKTKKIEEELRDATKAKEDHYSSTNSLGRVVLSDNRRESGFVTLKNEVGQNLQEMIALKRDILDKLSNIISSELRAKIYERFERKKPDEVGMSSEVILETESDEHTEALKQGALNHKVQKIVEPNLLKIAKKKEADDSLSEKGSGDHLLPGIDLDMEGEGAKEEDVEVADSVGPEPLVEAEPVAPSEISKPEVAPEPIFVPEPKAEPHTYVDMMEIGEDGEPRSIVNPTGEFQEDSIAAGTASLPVKLKPTNVADYIRAEKNELGGEIDTVRARVRKIAEGIPGVQYRPVEQPRNIDNIKPPVPRVEQVVETPLSATPSEQKLGPDITIDTPEIPQAPSSEETGNVVDIKPVIEARQAAEPEQQVEQPSPPEPKRGFLDRFKVFGRKSDGAMPTNTEELVKHIDGKGGELDTSHIFNATSTEQGQESEQAQKAA